MKTKIGTILDDQVVYKLKKRAVREKRPINEIIQEALIGYLEKGPKDMTAREKALKRLCVKSLPITRQELDEIITEDYYDQ